MKKYSKSEIRRLIKQGAIEINGKIISSNDSKRPFKDNDIVKVGKKIHFRVKII